MFAIGTAVTVFQVDSEQVQSAPSLVLCIAIVALQLRVYVMYQRSRRILWVNGVLFLTNIACGAETLPGTGTLIDLSCSCTSLDRGLVLRHPTESSRRDLGLPCARLTLYRTPRD